MVENIAGEKFKLRRKCHFKEEDENLNESLPGLKLSNNKLKIKKTHRLSSEPCQSIYIVKNQ